MMFGESTLIFVYKIIRLVWKNDILGDVRRSIVAKFLSKHCHVTGLCRDVEQPGACRGLWTVSNFRVSGAPDGFGATRFLFQTQTTVSFAATVTKSPNIFFFEFIASVIFS